MTEQNEQLEEELSGMTEQNEPIEMMPFHKQLEELDIKLYMTREMDKHKKVISKKESRLRLLKARLVKKKAVYETLKFKLVDVDRMITKLQHTIETQKEDIQDLNKAVDYYEELIKKV